MILTGGFLFYYDLWLALLVQTYSFVTFNKVMTAQYYLWYMTIIPVAAIHNRIWQEEKWRVVLALLVWIAGQATWGYYANAFENEGAATI